MRQYTISRWWVASTKTVNYPEDLLEAFLGTAERGSFERESPSHFLTHVASNLVLAPLSPQNNRVSKI